MKSAKEMFEELGYKEILSTPAGVTYKRICLTWDDEIGFGSYSKRVSVRKELTMQELKAINQQCQELGWLDE